MQVLNSAGFCVGLAWFSCGFGDFDCAWHGTIGWCWAFAHNLCRTRLPYRCPIADLHY